MIPVPFDYLAPDGVGRGSLLVVPFGRRDVTGVVVGVADRSDVPADKLVHPRRVLEERVPPDLVDLAEWMAADWRGTENMGKGPRTGKVLAIEAPAPHIGWP